MKFSIFILLLINLLYGESYKPKEGDVIFQPLAKMDLVLAIEGCTNSNYSHCGVVIKDNGKLVVIESLGMVQITQLEDFLRQSRGGFYEVYRLKDKYQTKKLLKDYRKHLKSFLTLPYDSRYRMDDEYIYCSELPYKAFLKTTGEKMGKLSKLRSLNWKPYKKTIEKYEGGPVPLERLMITPINLSKAKQLKKVYASKKMIKK